MDHDSRSLVPPTDATPDEAIRMACEFPARLIGLSGRGQLHPGYRADLTLFNADLSVRATVVNGHIAHDAGGHRG
jgi:N-acetylglucosamine-6-phosphate deacetylase